jgi:AraC-like DNA-binding protein
VKLSRPPQRPLRPYVETLWASDGADEPSSGSGRELVLPTGAMHLVVRLGGRPLRLFRDEADAVGRAVGCAIVGGARDGPYLRDVSMPGPSVGAMLRPGAAWPILGAPAGALSRVHTPLEALWGAGPVEDLSDMLSEAGSLSRQLELFEAALASRLPQLRGIDPRIAHALARLRAGRRVGDVAAQAGCSHRHFTALFREAVGLRPKAYCRVLRFGRALDRRNAEPALGWAELAAAEGYADQSHFIREFSAFAGLSPERYRRAAPGSPRHVPV